MAAFHDSNNTEYGFDRELADMNDDIHYVGVASASAVSTALTCGLGSDKWVQLFVSKIVDIPAQKPPAEGIVSVSACVEIISQRVIKTPTVTGYTDTSGTFIPGDAIANAECSHLTGRKLIIEGLITQKVIYTALEEEQPLHSATFVIPFSTFIVVDADTALSKNFRVQPYLEDVFTCMLSENSFFVNDTLFIKASIVC